MVATIKVLQGGARSISKYFNLMQELGNYYSIDAFSEWTGDAAQLLGLSGRIEQRDFENLLAGRDRSGQILGRKAGHNSSRVPGIDVTFSVPKSVSVLWAIGDIRVQHSVREATKTAVQRTLRELQSDLPLARRGKGGKIEISAKLVIAMFLHELSRANDPQLHVHCIIPNVCLGSDGRWSAVNSRKLHEWTMTLGGVFRSHLDRELQQRLSVTYCPGTSRDGSKGDWHEVVEIPNKLMDHVSKRSAQIQSSVDADRLGDSHARQRANFATRTAKNEPEDRDALREEWRVIAKRFGVDWQQLSNSLAEQTTNPHIQAWREMFQVQTRDVPAIEESTEERELLPLPETVTDEIGEESNATEVSAEPSSEIESNSQPDSPSRLNNEDQQPVTAPIDQTDAVIEESPELLAEPVTTKPKSGVPTKIATSGEMPEKDKELTPNKQWPVPAQREAEQSRKQTPERRVSSETHNGPEPFRSPQPEQVQQTRRPRDLTKQEEKLYEKRFTETAERLAERKAYYSASEFAASLGVQLRKDSLEVPHLIDRVRKDLENHENVVVLPHTQRPLYSSRTYFEKETSLVEDAKALQESRGVRVDLRTAEKYSYRQTDLNPEQARAAFHLLTQSSGLKMITAASGSGHEKTLTAVCEAFEKNGHQVVGTALSGRTSSALEKSTGIPTRTLASWLYHLDRSELRKFAETVKHEAKMFGRAAIGKPRWKRSEVKLPRGGVIVVEQAGMIDTHGMSRLLHHARQAGCTVLLAGDSAQLQPIGVGGPLEYLEQLSGTAELQEHQRQESEADRVAVDALRDHRPVDALQEYDDRGRLRVSEQPQEALVEEWAQSSAIRQPQDHIILTPTKKLRAEMNGLCQQERLTRQLISGPGIRHGDQRYHIGDRVRFARPQRRQGINTGDCGTVTGVNPITRSINVRLDDPPADEAQKRFGARQTATISLLNTDQSAIQLGYAATTHQVHGGECDHVWVLVDGGRTTSELAYSQISHGKESTRLFAQQRSEESERARVANEWSVSQKKDLAHDHINQIQLNLEH